MENEQRVCPGSPLIADATEIGLGRKSILFSHGGGPLRGSGRARAVQTRRRLTAYDL